MLLYKLFLIARLLYYLRGADDASSSSSTTTAAAAAAADDDGFPWEKLPLDTESISTYTTTTGIELRRGSVHSGSVHSGSVHSGSVHSGSVHSGAVSDVAGGAGPSEWTYLRSGGGRPSGGDGAGGGRGRRRGLATVSDATVKGIDGLDIGSTGNLSVPCTSDTACGGAWGGGSCVNATSGDAAGAAARHCVCGAGWYALTDTAKEGWQATLSDQEQSVCGYDQLPKLLILMASIFLGGCGVDRCILARLDGCSIIIGICKGVTVGACGVWYVMDIIFISLDMLPDARGIPLA
jgi:hypothetical protein